MNESISSSAVYQQPVGIGGWLILPTIGTCIAPFFYMKGLGDLVEIISGPNFSGVSDALKFFIWIELATNFVIMCGWVYAIYALFTKRRSFPRIFCGLSIAAIIIVIGDLAVAAGVFGIPADHNDYASLTKQMISCLIWVPYMARSVRVKNTFLKAG